ncbi:SUMF1/EgtB/PvdO family nonheme iron enzyme [Ekhidna sp.]|uniref:SUMF1/EgtB/PvdO family nonheme iron enzyme n=1 Tax=Ekhidna sp. TaxID=2608089 RepID=UPI003B501A28
MKSLIILLFCIASIHIKANNLSISNISLTGQNTSSDFTLVQFDISWDNSWRLNNRRDAVWVFVKYRTATAWNHATLNYVDGTAANDGHTEATGSTITTSSDGIGVFIYRDSDGNGSNNFTTVQIRWNYGTDGLGDDDIVDVQVFAIEMVYVPTGTFAAGDGTNGFTLTTINTGLATTLPSGSGSLGGEAGGYPTGETAPDNDSWPNGYNAFYCMKYEASQDQYVSFLNTLNGTQQAARVSAVTVGNFMEDDDLQAAPVNRNGIKCQVAPSGSVAGIYAMDLDDDDIYDESNDGENIPVNWVFWGDHAAYLDWAGLRPMTDMEFEKACRGTALPVAEEFAWGTTNIYATDFTFTNFGTASEGISNMGSNTGNALYNDTRFNTTGPIRGGIFAANATNKTREETGATYYGIMEMSGNNLELLVLETHATGRSFTGLHGDGELNASGDADVTNWPTSSGTGAGYGGGSRNQNAGFLEVSLINSTSPASRALNYGIRGVRSE